MKHRVAHIVDVLEHAPFNLTFRCDFEKPSFKRLILRRAHRFINEQRVESIDVVDMVAKQKGSIRFFILTIRSIFKQRIIWFDTLPEGYVGIELTPLGASFYVPAHNTKPKLEFP